MIYILQDNYLLFLIGISILGLLIGSFLNVVIYRLPIMMQDLEASNGNHTIFNLSVPRSHCPKCNKQLAWWHNIPVFSYLLLCGRCSSCQGKIHWRYPLVELMSSLATLLVAINFGVSVQTVVVLILLWGLIAAVFIDLDWQLLPDDIILPLLWLGLIANSNNMFTTPACAIMGAVIGYLIPWLIAYGFKLVRKIDGMGHGDFKLLAMFGAWLGWQMVPLILFMASLLGGVVGVAMIMLKKHKFAQPIPFGPYLVIAGWLMLFYPAQLMSLVGICSF